MDWKFEMYVGPGPRLGHRRAVLGRVAWSVSGEIAPAPDGDLRAEGYDETNGDRQVVRHGTHDQPPVGVPAEWAWCFNAEPGAAEPTRLGQQTRALAETERRRRASGVHSFGLLRGLVGQAPLVASAAPGVAAARPPARSPRGSLESAGVKYGDELEHMD